MNKFRHEKEEMTAAKNFYEIRLRDGGIVEIKLLSGTEVSSEEVKVLVRESLSLTNGIPYPVIIFVGEFVTFTEDARIFSAGEEGKAACTAEAYVINNIGHSIIGNFYLKFNRPVKPVKIFWKEEEALRWLQQFKRDGN